MELAHLFDTDAVSISSLNKADADPFKGIWLTLQEKPVSVHAINTTDNSHSIPQIPIHHSELQ